MSMTTNQSTAYQEITEYGIWLEDKGKYSRYGIGSEDSTWVCKKCEAVDIDPYDQECDCKAEEI
jgi:hypothetical protein